MMKILSSMMFMIPLIFMKKEILNITKFIFVDLFCIFLNFGFYFNFYNLSYFWGVDLLSFTLILLSFWICSLMLLASEGVYKHKDYKNV